MSEICDVEIFTEGGHRFEVIRTGTFQEVNADLASWVEWQNPVMRCFDQADGLQIRASRVVAFRVTAKPTTF